MAKRGRDRDDRTGDTPDRGYTPEERHAADTPRPSKTVLMKQAMSMVQDTTPGVRSPGQSAKSRVPTLPKKAMPERRLETPGEAWDKAQNRSPEIDKGGALDDRRCKGKPRSFKGNGKGRKFVPWCK